MPAAISYPGVYIEEIPSGVRTITGVPTSITAFVGRAGKVPEVPEPWRPSGTLNGGFDLQGFRRFCRFRISGRRAR